jgi:hypothetical protein
MPTCTSCTRCAIHEATLIWALKVPYARMVMTRAAACETTYGCLLFRSLRRLLEGKRTQLTSPPSHLLGASHSGDTV